MSLLCNLICCPLSPFFVQLLWTKRIFFLVQWRKLKFLGLKHLVPASSVAVCLSLCHIYSVQLPLLQESVQGPEVNPPEWLSRLLFLLHPIFLLSDWDRGEEDSGQTLFLHPPLKKESSNNHKQALIVLIYGAGLVSRRCIKVSDCIEINTRVWYPNFLIFYLFFFKDWIEP